MTLGLPQYSGTDACDTLAILSPLRLPERTCYDLSQFLRSLGIDDHVSGLRSIVRIVNDLLDVDPISLPPAAAQRWRYWQELLRELAKYRSELRDWRPERGQFRTYPVVAALVAVSPDAHPSNLFLKRLLILAAQRRSASPEPGFNSVLVDAADEIRLSIVPSKHRQERMACLSDVIEEAPSLAAVLQFKAGLSERKRIIEGSVGAGFINALDRLATLAWQQLLTTERLSPWAPAFDADEQLADGGLIALSEQDPDEPEQAFVYRDARPGAHWISQLGQKSAAHFSAQWLYLRSRAIPYDGVGPNPEQRARLAALLASLPKRVSDGELNPLTCLVMGLGVATGLDVDAVLRLTVGATGELRDGSIYHRRFPVLQRGAYAPDEARVSEVAASAAGVDLPLPTVVRTLLSYFDIGSRVEPRPLGELLGSTAAAPGRELSTAIGRLLREHIAGGADYRFIKVALRQTLRLKRGDEVTAYLLTAGSHHARPMLLYYTAIELREVVSEYCEAIEELFGERLDHSSVMVPEQWAGSRLVPKPECLRVRIEELAGRVQRALEQAKSSRASDDWVTAHNLYAAYVTLLLMHCSGHRPVVDPFCEPSSLSAAVQGALIEDKVVSERHRHRYVILPDLARSQLRAWRRHLRLLAERGQDAGWSTALTNTLKARAESGEIAPLVVLLEEGAPPRQTVSVTPARLNALLEAWPWPLNAGRHLLATGLRQYGLPVELIRLQLGHLLPGEDFFGAAWLNSPASAAAALRGAIDELLAEQGWRVLEGVQGRVRRSAGKAKSVHADKPLGPVRRRRSREAARRNDRKALAGLIEQVRAGKNPGAPFKKTEIGQVLAGLEAFRGDAMRYGRLYRLFLRYLRRRRDITPELAPPPVEIVLAPGASPFGPSWVVEYQRAADLRQQFAAHLAQKQTQGRAPMEAERVAEVLFAAALYSGVVDEARLAQLVIWLPKGALALNGHLVVDVPAELDPARALWRWVPDPVSAALIRGYHALYGAATAHPTLRAVNAQLRELLRTLGAAVPTSKEAIPRLSALAQAYWLHHAPGALRPFLEGSTQSRPLPASALMRLFTGRRLDGALPPADSARALMPELVATTSTVQTLEAGQSFMRLLDRLRRQASGLGGTGNIGVNVTRNRFFIKTLRHEIASGEGFPEVATVLAAWADHMVRHGTKRTTTPAFGTLDRYLFLLAQPLIECASEQPFLSLAADEYGELYARALACRGRGEQARMVPVLVEFHTFVMARWPGVEPADWSYLPPVDGLPPALEGVDAQLLTPAEYGRALELLATDADADIATRTRQATLLILGYRFGLRSGEATGLRPRDVELDAGRRYAIIYVRNNRYRDTKSFSSLRQVPAVGALNEREWALLEALASHGRLVEAEDGQGALLADPDRPRTLPNRTALVGRVQQAMRVVSGEPRLRFHHLRHSYACRMFTALLADQPSSPFWASLRQALWPGGIDAAQIRRQLTGHPEMTDAVLHALARLLGHARVNTTFFHYVHILDAYAHELVIAVDPPQLSARAWAYALWDGHRAVAQRLVRKRSDQGPLPVTRHWPAPVRAFSPPYAASDDVSALPARQMLEAPVTLTLLDRLLLAAAERVLDPETLGAHLLLAPERVRRVIAVATEIANESGYLAIAPRLSDTVPSTVNGAVRRETGRLRRVLGHWQARLDTPLTGSELEVLDQALLAWRRAHSAGNWLLFGVPEQAEVYLAGLALLGVDRSDFEVVMDARSDTAVPAFLSSRRNEIEYRALPRARYPATPQQQLVRIGLRLRTQHALSYQRTLDRAAFLLAVLRSSEEFTCSMNRPIARPIPE